MKLTTVISAVVGLLFVAIAVAGFMIWRLPEMPAHETTARVISISGVPSRVQGPLTRVTAQADDGSIGTLVVGDASVTCDIGDRVRARKIGIVLELERSACRGTGWMGLAGGDSSAAHAGVSKPIH